MKILIVEDEVKMANFLERGLKEENYEVDVALDGETGWEYATTREYDLLLLDWMLPKMSGMELCQKLRQSGKNVPVLILTAKDLMEDKIKGLNQGADDYLTKPFNFEELLARIRALLRRPVQIADKTIFVSGDLKLDLIKRKVWSGDTEIDLSQKEFALLEFFMRREGDAISRTSIAEQVWDLHFDPMSNTIDVYINFLRKKLAESASKAKIETVRGVGYRLARP